MIKLTLAILWLAVINLPKLQMFDANISNESGRSGSGNTSVTRQSAAQACDLQIIDPPPTPFPILFVHDGDRFYYQNNFLHGLPPIGNQEQDIEDNYLIDPAPYVSPEDSTISFVIKENSLGSCTFDQFSLIAVDHSKESTVGVTDKGVIVLYYNKQLISPKYAEKSGIDVTQELSFDSSFSKTVKGEEKEHLFVQYSNNEKVTGANLALIFDPSQRGIDPCATCSKDYAGYLFVNGRGGNSEGKELQFTSRLERSVNILPVSSNEKISNVDIWWKHEFDLSYFVVASLDYSGFTKEPLTFLKAENSRDGDILKSLYYRDSIYSSLDSTSFITLLFKNSARFLPKDSKRDYVLSVKGRTLLPSFNAQRKFQDNQTVLEKQSSYKFKLFSNFPNPFNPVTKINYELPASALSSGSEKNVTLKVYNLIGEEVAVLINEKQNPGKHSITFDGSNYPSGIYFYKLQLGEYQQISKMILLK